MDARLLNNNINFTSDGISTNVKITSLASQLQFSGVASADVLLSGVDFPIDKTDVANKEYVDTRSWKTAVAVASTINIVSLSTLQTIDSVGISIGDRLLIKDQSSPVDNGIYIAATGSWTRSQDMDTGQSVSGAVTFVQKGATQADTSWSVTSDPATVGSTSIVWAQFGNGGSGTPGGPTTSVQYNNAGAFGGVSTFTFNGTTLSLFGISASTLSISGSSILQSISSSVLNATIITSGSLSVSGLSSLQNVISADISSTGISSTILNSTTITAGSLSVSGNSTLTNITSTNIVATNISVTSLNVVNPVSLTNLTVSNLFATSGSITNLVSTNITSTNITSTNLVSTSSTSGSIKVTGILDASTITAGTLNVSGLSSLQNLTSSNITCTNLSATNGIISVITTVNLLATSATDSISTTTGAMIVSGGIGIGKSINVGGTIGGNVINSLTTASSLTVIPNTTIQGLVSHKVVSGSINTAGDVSYTAEQVYNGVISRDPNGANRTDTFPTASSLISLIQNPVDNISFEFVISNTAGTSSYYYITLTAGTGITLVGRTTISSGEVARFIAVVTSVGSNTITIYSLSQGLPNTLLFGSIPTIGSGGNVTQYIQWGLTAGNTSTYVNNISIGRAGVIRSAQFNYVNSTAIGIDVGETLTFSIGSTTLGGTSFTLLTGGSNIVQWTNSVTGTWPTTTIALNIPITQTTQLSVRSVESGTITPTTANVTVCLVIELI
jgi:hypothetical protein